MSEVIQAFLHHDLISLIRLVGLFGVTFMVFAESGLFIGFFLPGDSLLFTAGLLASSNFAFFKIWILVPSVWVAAVLGDNVGYEFGRRAGRKLFKRKKSFLFNPDNVIKAQEFYEKHGGKTIILARFIPVVRTFAPIVAGMGKMDRKKFMAFNLIGGTVWSCGLTLSGYYLGSLFPNVDKYLLPIIIVIITLSVLPPFLHLYKENRKSWREKSITIIRRFIKYKI